MRVHFYIYSIYAQSREVRCALVISPFLFSETLCLLTESLLHNLFYIDILFFPILYVYIHSLQLTVRPCHELGVGR